MSTEAGDTSSAPAEGAPCWIELMADDPSKLKEFYTAIFPAWVWKEGPAEYHGGTACFYEFAQPKGLSGGILQRPASCAKGGEQPMGVGLTVYYFSNDLEATEKKIHGLGGTTVLPKTEQGTSGWYINCKDPEGNRFGVYQVNWENFKK